MSKKDAYYFYQSGKARYDDRLLRLRMNHGSAGYGVYWGIIEMCCNENKSTPFNPYEIAKELCCDVGIVEDILNDKSLFELDLCSSLVKPRGVGFKWGKSPNLSTLFGRVRLFNKNVKEWYRIRKIIFERDNYTCQYCGAVGGNLEADHIIPFSKGGSDDISNLITACRKCNRQKKNKSIKEFKEWQDQRK